MMIMADDGLIANFFHMLSFTLANDFGEMKLVERERDEIREREIV